MDTLPTSDQLTMTTYWTSEELQFLQSSPVKGKEIHPKIFFIVINFKVRIHNKKVGSNEITVPKFNSRPINWGNVTII